MRTKHLVVLSVILALFVSAVVLKKHFFRDSTERSEYKKFDASVDLAAVAAIEVTKGKGPLLLRLSKTDGVWRVASRWSERAASGRIEMLAQVLGSLNGELRSSTSGIFTDYGIGDDEAYRLTFMDTAGKKVREILIGTVNPAGGSSFARKAGSLDVYFVDADLLSTIGVSGEGAARALSIDGWCDLALVAFDAMSAGSIKVTKEADGRGVIAADIVLRRDQATGEEKWEKNGGTYPFDIDGNKVKDYLNRLATVRAMGLVDPKGSGYGFEKPACEIVVGAGGASGTVTVGGPVAADRPAEAQYVRGSEGQVLVVNPFLVRLLSVDASAFLSNDPLRIGAGGISSVSVKSGKEMVALDTAGIEKKGEYIGRLKAFFPSEMLLGVKYASGLPGPADATLEIRRADGTATTLEALKGSDGLFACVVAGRSGVFSITKEVYDGLFGDIGSLDIGATAPAPAKR